MKITGKISKHADNPQTIDFAINLRCLAPVPVPRTGQDRGERVFCAPHAPPVISYISGEVSSGSVPISIPFGRRSFIGARTPSPRGLDTRNTRYIREIDGLGVVEH